VTELAPFRAPQRLKAYNANGDAVWCWQFGDQLLDKHELNDKQRYICGIGKRPKGCPKLVRCMSLSGEMLMMSPKRAKQIQKQFEKEQAIQAADDYEKMSEAARQWKCETESE
jgi:hypothetical protein